MVGGIITVVDVHPTLRCTSLTLSCPLGRDGVGDCHDASRSALEISP